MRGGEKTYLGSSSAAAEDKRSPVLNKRKQQKIHNTHNYDYSPPQLNTHVIISEKTYLGSSSTAAEDKRGPVLNKRTQRSQQMELARVLLGGQVHQLHVVFE